MVGEGRVTRDELKFVALFGATLLFVTGLPYLYGYLSTPPDKYYMGLVYGVHDHAQYLSWARESATGIFIENKLTSEQHEAVFFNLLWWSIGRAEGYLGLPFAAVYQAFRLIAGAFFVVAVYYFSALFFTDRTQRRVTLALVCLTSGFGWILIVLKQFTGELAFPNDVYTTPGNSFFTMLGVPHLTFAAALQIVIFTLVLRAVHNKGWRSFILAGLVALFLGLQHNYELVTIYSVLAAFGVLLFLRNGFSPRLFVGLGIVVALSAPAPLYWAIVLARSPMWQQVLAQYPNLGANTPDLFHLTILLGPLFLVALLTFRGLLPLAEKSTADLFVGVWFLLNLLLVYLPINFQIMLLNGYQAAVGVVAARGLFQSILPWLQARLAAQMARRPLGSPRAWLQKAAIGILITIVLPTNGYLLAWRFFDLNRHGHPYYLYRDEVAALNWLAQQAGPMDVVLSSLASGYYIPGLTGTHAFLAHGAATVDFDKKRMLVSRFFDAGTSEEQRRAILDRYGVSFVFFGPEERALGSFSPQQAPYLEEAFHSPLAVVYRVRTEGLVQQ